MKPVILDHLPIGLLDLAADQVHTQLDGPTVIHLPGRAPRPLVVSVLQHGNETSGWEAIRRLLKGKYQRDVLPRSLILIIGNVKAAAENVRYLPNQPDLNRCWPGSTHPKTLWHKVLDEITQHVKKFEPFGSIDIHNNTGKNPHYAAVNSIEPRQLQLASEFSRVVVYFTEPRGVQSQAFGQFCPAVTLECGLSQDSSGADHAMAYLERVLHMESLPGTFPTPDCLELYQMLATIHVSPSLAFDFQPLDNPAHPNIEQDKTIRATDEVLHLLADLDIYNFQEWPRGFQLAHYTGHEDPPLIAKGHNGEDLTDQCFEWSNGRVIARMPLMPAMLTLDPFAVRHDCLCYVMERLNLHALAEGIDQYTDGASLPEAIDQ